MKFFDGNIAKEPYLLSEVTGTFDLGHHVFPSNVSSSSNKLLVNFVSDEFYRAHGFAVYIHVEPLINLELSGDACSITNPCKIEHGHCQSDDECQGYLKCGYKNCPAELGYHPKARCCYDYCSQWLDMENGILTSPWYPKMYPSEFRCRTLINVGMTVAGPRTITLEFLHFKVSKSYSITDVYFKSISNNSRDGGYIYNHYVTASLHVHKFQSFQNRFCRCSKSF